jgi:ribonuclease HI
MSTQIEGWYLRGWRTAHLGYIVNRDLWEELYKLSKYHNVLWNYIKGHNGHPEQGMADELAKKAIRKELFAT